MFLIYETRSTIKSMIFLLKNVWVHNSEACANHWVRWFIPAIPALGCQSRRTTNSRLSSYLKKKKSCIAIRSHSSNSLDIAITFYAFEEKAVFSNSLSLKAT